MWSVTSDATLAELRRLDAFIHQMIAEREAEEAAPDIPEKPGREVVARREIGSVTYQLEKVCCGKESCKKCAGGASHGPYWYAYWWSGGRTRSKYIGKNLPDRES